MGLVTRYLLYSWLLSQAGLVGTVPAELNVKTKNAETS